MGTLDYFSLLVLIIFEMIFYTILEYFILNFMIAIDPGRGMI